MKILIVEDIENNIILLEHKLRKKQHEIQIAKNGKIAVETSEQFLPDIILMDMRMPVMNGYEATALIKSKPELQHIPIIGISAHAAQSEIDKALAAGCDEYITKPINFKILDEVLLKYEPINTRQG